MDWGERMAVLRMSEKRAGWPTRYTTIALLLLAACLLLVWPGATAGADEGSIQVVSTSVANEFPDGFRFMVEADSDTEITSVAVRLRIGRQTRGAYEYLDFEEGRLVDAELLWRTDTRARYIPPGTAITYRFEIEDSEGNRVTTDPKEFVYHDARFTWEEVSSGSVTVSYHGPVQTRARLIRDTIIQTLEHIGPILGADIEEPIRVTMYNNRAEMLGGLPPGSTTIRRELITEGQAFTRIGTLLVLGGNQRSVGTASHEVTHILVHRAGDSTFRSVSSWLNEGLAEYGNLEPGFSYDLALQFALATDRLLPITTLRALPGDPEDVIIFYGEARSIVRFMVERYGSESMTELMGLLKEGESEDDALTEVYGVDGTGLENQWREAIGAPEYVPPEVGAALPTPIPWPTVLPFSLTPQPGSATISSLEATSEAEGESAAAEEMEPTATAVPEPSGQGAGLEPQLEDETTPAADQNGDEPRAGGGCGAPTRPGSVDISLLALLVGVVGVGASRRFRRRAGRL